MLEDLDDPTPESVEQDNTTSKKVCTRNTSEELSLFFLCDWRKSHPWDSDLTALLGLPVDFSPSNFLPLWLRKLYGPHELRISIRQIPAEILQSKRALSFFGYMYSVIS